ncbi:RDD family protein [sulfur-oxidizing endosymbiont of Gigantopelta aegis]|uniref:RDD family protein n=1 Tax=sulfur-oxidizing endosymbiont of Gigantopelta aegis TaxID=2794934 RepID=UPI0018DDA7E8|nr:RDD family protein [sulfur-oxidizing endosymbiont of Gigantopelta aegis]
MDENVYKTPESNLSVKSEENDNIATRWSRFWASLIDGLMIIVVTVPTMYFTGGFDGVSEGIQQPIAYTVSIGILGLVIFMMINLKFLKNSGQTVGKKALDIKVVTMDDELPTLSNHFLKRYSVYFLPGQIPLAGQFFSMLNILFIFGKNKRCIHDYAAGTKVVKC